MNPERFFTHSLHDPRVGRILAAALDAVEPGAVVERFLGSHPLPPAGRIFALGIGKAAVPMTRALSRLTPLARALVITKHVSPPGFEPVTVIESGHPVPDARSLAAGEAALEFVSALREDDLLVCLVSGGGSALMTAPIIPLEQLQALTSALLTSGARIDEFNTLRRRLDRVKGGGIARATRARVLSLILSDVVGSPLEAIASGPTAPDPTTREDAMVVLEKYGLLHQPAAPGRDPASQWQVSVADIIRSTDETPKLDDPLFDRVHNIIVGDNALAIQTAVRQAEREGFKAESLGNDWQGEARDVGVRLAKKLRVTSEAAGSPVCLVAGGETTVSLTEQRGRSETVGRGGRNQELALAAVPELAGIENVLLIGLATDGEDGPTDAAGAVVSGETFPRAQKIGISVKGHLSGHDAYRFFEKLDDLLKIGPTGTNVNDLVFLLRL